ncbi:MAG TPA: DNA (cytosine-5-)-methyltransferase [Phycisphaerales bacterium]|nr:DNA (cytosine-5-)-methyltransferase [Phycisphaerales bacterium]
MIRKNNSKDTRVIELTPAAKKHGNLYITTCGPDFFPKEAIGSHSREKGLGKLLTLHVAGLANPVKTDIPTDKKTGKPRRIFRERRWFKDFVQIHKLHSGDRVTIQRINKNRYSIFPSNAKRTEMPKRAIDLYSGIGGWDLGLKMAGIKTVASYDYWKPANLTHSMNFTTPVFCEDIRKLPLDNLPTKVDFIVGSPPCTQFSYSNRGGGGDIQDGLVDIRKFLEVVEYLKPKYWAMENVPRVKTIIEREIEPGGSLQEYKNLFTAIEIFDCSDYGLPQARKRMVAGNFPIELLRLYSQKTSPKTLGEVVNSLQNHTVIDPLHGIKLNAQEISEIELETELDKEELRMNSEAKTYHPVYNKMSFPDRLDRSSRTVTALCTRVSRESIVIENPKRKGMYRRLSIRERACLQGFPITYQFYANSYSNKLKMIGNAIPPILTYYIASSMLEIQPEKIASPDKAAYSHPLPSEMPPVTLSKKTKSKYSWNRKFKIALPNLRFGSGVRFELVNEFDSNKVRWAIRFYYGSSKAIRTISIDEQLSNLIQPSLVLWGKDKQIEVLLNSLLQRFENRNSTGIQYRWNNSKQGIHPFTIADSCGSTTKKIHKILSDLDEEKTATFLRYAFETLGENHQANSANGMAKIERNSLWILSGLIVSASFNAKSQIAKYSQINLES